MQPQASASVGDLRRPLWLLAGFWGGIAISIAIVIRRLVELSRTSQAGTTALAEINTTFSSHAALTLAHIIPALIFVLPFGPRLVSRWRN